MPILARGEQRRFQLAEVWVTFEGAAGADHDMTDGEFLRTIQRGGCVSKGIRVRMSQQDDSGSWFEVWLVHSVERRQRFAVA